MASKSLAGLQNGLAEVRELQQANPTPTGGFPALPRVVRAINRASVVLLSSHFERYLRSVNEEAVDCINSTPGLSRGQLSSVLRLQHTESAIAKIAETQWDNRSGLLERFVETDGWLWGASPKYNLEHDRLLTWMKSPSPDRVIRLFRLWGIPDVFSAITRTKHTRGRMFWKIKEMVDKRNDIAHGISHVAATRQDISTYVSTVKDFCSRTDLAMARSIVKCFSMPPPW